MERYLKRAFSVRIFLAFSDLIRKLSLHILIAKFQPKILLSQE